MIVCHCHAVSDREIAAVVRAGASDLGEVGQACGAGTECAGCRERIEKILDAVAPRPLVLKAS